MNSSDNLRFGFYYIQNANFVTINYVLDYFIFQDKRDRQYKLTVDFMTNECH